MAASASILAGTFPNPTIQDIFELNDVVAHLKSEQVTLHIKAIKEEDIRHFVIADSSFDIAGRVKPQHGSLEAKLNAGEDAPISLISWRSRGLRRKAGSTMLCEAISLSTALAALEKQVAVLESFRFFLLRAEDHGLHS